MLIAIVGASLSHQTTRYDTGEAVGYFEFLQKQLPKPSANEKMDFIQITHPGNRMSDAGLVNLQRVIEAQPDVCMIEACVEDSSRGVPVSYEELRYYVLKLIQNKIVPVFVVIPLPVNAPYKETEFYRMVGNLSKSPYIPLIEVDLSRMNPESCFDGVHTKAEGGMLVASQVSHALQKLDIFDIKSRLPSIKEPSGLHIAFVHLPKTVYTSLRLKISSIGRGIGRLRLIQEQYIGPMSPVINVDILSYKEQLFFRHALSIWDPYCHYERSSFVTLVPSIELESDEIIICIDLSPTPPNYADCRREHVDWPKLQDLYLKAVGPIYIISDVETEMSVLGIF